MQVSSLWVPPLQCLSRSDALTRTAEHSSRMWVRLQCLSRSDSLTRMAEHRMWVLFNVWTDHIHRPEWLNTLHHSGCESLSVFKQITSTDQNGWTFIQRVSSSPVFEQTRFTDKKGWPPIQLVSPSSVFEQFRSTDQNNWTSRVWVPLQCLSRSGPLTTEHLGCKSISSFE